MVLFWIWAKLPMAESTKYRYEVHLDHSGPVKTATQPRHYSGTVQSLEVSSNELIKKHLRSVVFFSQSYLRKTVRFSHNLPPARTEHKSQHADVIKYTVKIMRQS